MLAGFIRMNGKINTIFSIQIGFLILPLVCCVDIFEYNHVPDQVKVERRIDAGDAEFVAVNFVGHVAEQGREAETYNVTTPDGYILTMFRVRPNDASPNSPMKNKAVFLHPGLAASADCFVIFGKERSIVHELSNAGYDVWIGNPRGNTYSRAHQTLKPTEADFWDFSVDEFALQDLPTMLDYVLEMTGEPDLTFIGHSLGTTTILMLLSTRPEYNKKVDLIFHFAPMVYWKAVDPTRIIFGLGGHMFQSFIDPRGATELFPQSGALPALFKRICLPNNLLELCYFPLDLMVGHADPTLVNRTSLLEYFNYYPAGTSAKTVYQYTQHARSGKLQKYDYLSPELNFRHYGQVTPPDYDLSNITVPYVIFRALNDPLSMLADSKALMAHMSPEVPVLYRVVDHPRFNHLDFVTAKDVKRLINDPVLEIMKTFHRNKYGDNQNSIT